MTDTITRSTDFAGFTRVPDGGNFVYVNWNNNVSVHRMSDGRWSVFCRDDDPFQQPPVWGTFLEALRHATYCDRQLYPRS